MTFKSPSGRDCLKPRYDHFPGKKKRIKIREQIESKMFQIINFVSCLENKIWFNCYFLLLRQRIFILYK